MHRSNGDIRRYFAVDTRDEYIALLLNLPVVQTYLGYPAFPWYRDHQEQALPDWVPSETLSPSARAHIASIVYSSVNTPVAADRTEYSSIFRAVLAWCGNEVDETRAVVAFAGDDITLVAAAYAGACGRCLEILPHPDDAERWMQDSLHEAITIFCSSSQATHPWFSRLPFYTDRSIGLIPALDASMASLMSCKMLATGNHIAAGAVFANFVDNIPDYEGDGIQIWSRDRFTKAKFASLTDPGTKPWELLLLAAHSHGDHIFLGEFSLHAGRGATSVASLRAGVVMADICMGAQLVERPAAHEERLGYHILTGWPYAYVSTTVVKDNSTVECSFFHALVRSGYSLGTATRLMNMWLLNGGADFPCYILFGDPDVCITGSEPPSPCAVEVTQQSDDCWTIQIDSQQGYLQECMLPVDASTDHFRLSTADQQLGRNMQYALLRSSPTQLRIFLFSWERMSAAPLHIDVQRISPHTTGMELLLRLLPERLAELGACGIRLQSAKGQIGQLENEATYLARLLTKASYDLRAGAELMARQHSIEGQVESLQKTVLQSLLQLAASGPFLFTERYRDVFQVETAVSHDVGVCLCGAALIEKQVRHSLHRSIARKSLICPACGVIFDTPAYRTPIQLVSPMYAERGERLTIRVVRAHDNDSSRVATIGMALQEEQHLPTQWDITPRQQRVPVASALEHEIVVQVPGDSVPGQYRLKGFALMSLELYYFTHSITVR